MKTTFPRRFNSQPPKIKISLVACCLLLCATFFAIIFPPQVVSSSEQFQVTDLSQLPPIEQRTIFTQKFEASDDFLGFGLLFINYDRLADQGTIKIEVLNEETPVGTCFVNVSDILPDISFFYCDVPLSKEQYYNLAVSAVDDVSSSIALLATSTPVEKASLAINQKTQNQLIVMDFTTKRKNYMLAWAFAMLTALTFCYLAANMKRKSHGSKKS